VELGVEEQIELGDAHLKEFSKREVPQFVEQYQQADSQQELKQSYQKYIHCCLFVH
jgi:hypothetical protein